MKLFGVSLGEGNPKVGEVLTFSLPSKKTCPGASLWCLKHCYANRYEQRRPNCQAAYLENLNLANNIEEFKKVMTGVLPRIIPYFRIHVSGDFFSEEYIKAWTEICKAFPQTIFWSYTRSWTIPELRSALDELKSLPNVQLFASVDIVMPLPTEDWRIAFTDIDPRANGIICNTQNGEENSCVNCGYCFRQSKGNVIFKVH